jgi:intein/homing endonuclease
MGIKPIIRLEFEHDAWIECTPDHKLYISDTEYKTANEFNIGDNIVSLTGELKLLNKIDLKRSEEVYDLI